MSAHVDGCLDPARARRLADHLATCAACRQDLAALQRTVQLLQQLAPVAPPPDLTAKIHARLRRSRQPAMLAFLSLPQTRVALAASLVIVLTTLGIRQMYATRPPPVTVVELQPPVAPAPAIVPKPPAAPLQESEKQMEKGTPLVKKGAEMDALRAANGAVAENRTVDNRQLRALAAEQAAGDNQIAAGQDELAAKRIVAPRAPSLSASTTGVGGGAAPAPVASVQALPQPVASAVFRQSVSVSEADSVRRTAVSGYTFRTDRPDELRAIVNRHAVKTEQAGNAIAADGSLRAGVPNKDKDASASRAATLEVALPAAELPALVEELRRAGAVLVNPAARAEERQATAALEAVPRNAMAADGLTAGASAAATNILVRFTFLPLAP